MKKRDAPGGATIELDGDRLDYGPGEAVSGRYRLDPELADGEVKSLELSVLWRTEGKGDEDLGIRHFEGLPADPEDRIDPRAARTFAAVLPGSPLSYDGHLIKIHWCVRLRAVLADGRRAFAEAPFRLGDVAPVEEAPA